MRGSRIVRLFTNSEPADILKWRNMALASAEGRVLAFAEGCVLEFGARSSGPRVKEPIQFEKGAVKVATEPDRGVALPSELNQNPSFFQSLPIVLVGNDRRLLDLLERVINGRGLTVQSLTPGEADELAHSSYPRVWVFCNTEGRSSLLYLASTVQRYSPDSRLVLLEGPWPLGHEAALFHRILDPSRNVNSLLDALRELTIGGDHRLL
jgi:hypothetical protein